MGPPRVASRPQHFAGPDPDRHHRRCQTGAGSASDYELVRRSRGNWRGIEKVAGRPFSVLIPARNERLGVDPTTADRDKERNIQAVVDRQVGGFLGVGRASGSPLPLDKDQGSFNEP